MLGKGGKERQRQGRRGKEDRRWRQRQTEVRVQPKQQRRRGRREPPRDLVPRALLTGTAWSPSHKDTRRKLPRPEPKALCWGLSSLSKTSSPHFQLWPPSPPSGCPSPTHLALSHPVPSLCMATAWPALPAYPGQVPIFSPNPSTRPDWLHTV